MIIAMKSGIRGLMTFVIEVSAIPTPTKRTEPTGGVQSPMQRFKTMMIPKCVGSIPRLTAMGRKMGVKIKTAGVMSMKVPTARRIKLIMSKMIIGLSDRASRAELIF